MSTATKFKAKAAKTEEPLGTYEGAFEDVPPSFDETQELPVLTLTEPPRPEKLTGDALVAYAAGHKGMDVTAEQLALGAGYVRKNKGTIGFHGAPQAYSAALAIASGLAPESSPTGRPKASGERKKRSLAYVVSTNPKTGGTAVTGAYFRELGVAPGTQFRIIVDKDAQELVLQALEGPTKACEAPAPLDEATSPEPAFEAAPEALPEAEGAVASEGFPLVGDEGLIG